MLTNEHAESGIDDVEASTQFPVDAPLNIPILPEAGHFQSSARLTLTEKRVLRKQSRLSFEERRKLVPDLCSLLDLC